ncbi:unnamed protein product [Mytilus coruscus]|uniref:Uncharacterized protein n=1 Tax=Mytilus coruscus TaxID=42192 RepID=A0A6J8ANB0_MYTCO|nr:unnamed protein product [Mytilus coruscus]
MSLVGMDNNFQQMLKCDVNSVRNTLMDICATKWHTNLSNSPKLRTYRTFKSTYSTESYIKLNLKRSERSVLAHFRCGIFPLRLETGRFVGESEYQRICRMCDSGHVKMKYTILQWSTQSIILWTVLNLNNSEKLNLLLSEYPRKTARYLEQSLTKRRQHLYLNN